MKKFFYFFVMAVMAIGMVSCNGGNGASSNCVTVDGKSYNVKYAYDDGETIVLCSCPLEEQDPTKGFCCFQMHYERGGEYSYSFTQYSKNAENYTVAYTEHCYTAPTTFEKTDDKLTLDIKNLDVQCFTADSKSPEEPKAKSCKMSVHYSGSLTKNPY